MDSQAVILGCYLATHLLEDAVKFAFSLFAIKSEIVCFAYNASDGRECQEVACRRPVGRDLIVLCLIARVRKGVGVVLFLVNSSEFCHQIKG